MGDNNSTKSKFNQGKKRNNSAQFSLLGLVPFIASFFVALYFCHYVPREESTFISMVFKCLPTLSLSLFVRTYKDDGGPKGDYAQNILMGLLVSIVGDAYLSWPDSFLYSVIAYGIAQIFYINSMGFKDPMYPLLGKIIYTGNIGVLYIIMPGMVDQDIFLAIGVTVYSFLLMTMVWRAWARIKSINDLWNWSIFWSFIGGLFFGISDLIVGIDFFHTKIPKAEMILMGSYFIAELGLALSIFDES